MPKTARVPSLRHHRPSGRAVCTIAGKDIYCGRYGSPEAQAEYDRLIGEWLASGRTVSQASGDGSVSVAELLVAYLRFCETFYRPPSTEIERIRRALRPVAQKYGHTAACDFGPLALKAVREGLVAERLSRRFINQLCGRIVRCWKWGCENEMVPPLSGRASKRSAACKRAAPLLARLPECCPLTMAFSKRLWLP